jgi:primosomal protein N' (replication factor Y)
VEQQALQRYLDIAVPTPLRRSFHYLPPPDFPANIQPGSRIRVPFRNKKVTGILLGYVDSITTDKHKIKPAEELLDTAPIVPETLCKLCIWAADYYHHPIGEVFAAALPNLLRRGDSPEDLQFVLTARGRETELKPRAHRQRAMIDLLSQNPQGLSRDELGEFSSAIIHSLIDKELVTKEIVFQQPFSHTRTNYQGTQPTGEQNDAIEAINSPGTYLLQGVTGSGKTEVYLRLIERMLDQGLQSLVLVPEIGLTPQTLKRFETRFDIPITVVHSGLTDTERLRSWQQARTGQAGIVIGTRSAVFTPFAKPGLIIVDEEHDASFKQHEGFKYSARDLAVLRASWDKTPILLGSATPSLESLHNAISGKYTHLQLRKRPAGIAQETYQVISLKHKEPDTGFSPPLLKLMRQHLDAKGQILIFLNRRGFAPVLLCTKCHWMANCPRCDARMTYHLSSRRLICHHCTSESSVPQHCAQCQSSQLLLLGLGTQRIEEHLKLTFGDVPVLRIDRDSTRRKGSFDKLLDEINRQDPAILIGTQMLAKGHHFSNVTLSVMLEVDSSFYSADYKAMERMGQLILQVGGRSGRSEKPGTVAIQTHFPDQPLLKQLIDEGYNSFADTILSERRDNGLPPYCHQALVRAESTSRRLAMDFLEELEGANNPHVDVFGPFPSSMEKRAGRYRALLMISSQSRQSLHKELKEKILTAESSKLGKKLRWSVDIDPIDLF